MELIPKAPDSKGSKPETEKVEDEKQEYKLIGRYLRTKGLKLWAYRPHLSIGDELIEVDAKMKNTINLIPDQDKIKLIPKDLGMEEAAINSQNIHFEALNRKSAEHRLKRFKQGKIKELCNLTLANPDGIKFW